MLRTLRLSRQPLRHNLAQVRRDFFQGLQSRSKSASNEAIAFVACDPLRGNRNGKEAEKVVGVLRGCFNSPQAPRSGVRPIRLAGDGDLMGFHFRQR
jgi:hypothetical protein